MHEYVRLAFVGDLMLGRKISRALRTQAPEWFWGDTLPLLRDAHAVIGNLESPIAAGPLKQNKIKTFHFRADPKAVEILKAGNVRFVCLANNHTMDYGGEALRQTLATLDEAGIAHAGAGMTLTDAQKPVGIEPRGLNVGLIAATDNMRTFAATAGRPGANFIGTLVTGRKRGMDWIARSVTHMRDAGAELIVASLHWGPNMRTAPPSWFRKFGHDIIDRGVDVIHGHSAHVFQGVERYRNGLILYDGGDLIDDYWKFPFCETFWTYIFLLDINPDGTTRLRLVPAENHFESHRSPARLATGRLARRMNARMIAMCRALDTDVDETPDGLSITGPTIVRQ